MVRVCDKIEQLIRSFIWGDTSYKSLDRLGGWGNNKYEGSWWSYVANA